MYVQMTSRISALLRVELMFFEDVKYLLSVCAGTHLQVQQSGTEAEMLCVSGHGHKQHDINAMQGYLHRETMLHKT